ncbi:MAG: hypothetical protein ACR2QC_01475 [Gammaproteobacteria bacterium]
MQTIRLTIAQQAVIGIYVTDVIHDCDDEFETALLRDTVANEGRELHFTSDVAPLVLTAFVNLSNHCDVIAREDTDKQRAKATANDSRVLSNIAQKVARCENNDNP